MPELPCTPETGQPELPATTEAEQMYLITVARAWEDRGAGPLPLTDLAAQLGVAQASANEKVKKLAARGLVEYTPYRGVDLTAVGRRIAERVLRTRRLWSRFMADHLGFSAAEADALACHLEHATPPHAAERLADYLGDPTSGPLGKPIPPPESAEISPVPRPLADVLVGESVEVVAASVDEAGRRFLAAESIVPGAEVRVVAAGESGVLVQCGGDHAHLDRALARSVAVQPVVSP